MIVSKHSIKSMKLIKLASVSRYGYLSPKQIYQSMLESSRSSMKKPNLQSIQAQKMLLHKILYPNLNSASSNSIAEINAASINQIAKYLISIRNFKLLSSSALDEIQKWVDKYWNNLEIRNQVGCICVLVQQHRYGLYQKYVAVIKSEQKVGERRQELGSKSGKQRLSLDSILWKYCWFVVNRSLKFSNNNNDVSQFSENDNLLTARHEWSKQCLLIHRANTILSIKPTHTHPQFMSASSSASKGRSNLQIQIQALLTTLDYKFKREVNIYGFTVDFIVQNKNKLQQNKNNQFIIEVLGSHHYTIQQKLFGKDILRVLILQQIMPVVLIHFSQINLIKGVQNRLEYLESVINARFTKRKIFYD